jgi:aldehyde dehydrogenase (NAD+)
MFTLLEVLTPQDADIEQAVKWAHVGIMSNSGQVCCATSRILVHESIYEKFIQKLIDFTTTASVVGDPFDEKTSHGPQVSKLQFERVMKYVERGKAEGAKLVLGGTTPGTNLISPTVFKDVEVRSTHITYPHCID